METALIVLPTTDIVTADGTMVTAMHMDANLVVTNAMVVEIKE